jgi:hypothetical protein
MASAHFSLQPAWGCRPSLLPAGWLDLTPADTELASIERLLRRLPEEQLRVRLPGNTPGSGAPQRVRLRDITDLRAELAHPQRLHLQAAGLHLHDSGFSEVARRFRLRLSQDIAELRAPSTEITIGLFLSSGGAVAPFHADQEHNFLCQVVGDKKMHMFPSGDLEIFPCLLRERLAAEDIHVLETYRPELESRAEVAHLVPGTVLYHPPMGPHWVDTGRDSYSLSISLSVVSPSVDRTLLLHKLNRRLRRLGWRPSPVGRNPAIDDAKWVLARAMRGMTRLSRGARG